MKLRKKFPKFSTRKRRWAKRKSLHQCESLARKGSKIYMMPSFPCHRNPMWGFQHPSASCVNPLNQNVYVLTRQVLSLISKFLSPEVLVMLNHPLTLVSSFVMKSVRLERPRWSLQTHAGLLSPLGGGWSHVKPRCFLQCSFSEWFL